MENRRTLNDHFCRHRRYQRLAGHQRKDTSPVLCARASKAEKPHRFYAYIGNRITIVSI